MNNKTKVVRLYADDFDYLRSIRSHHRDTIADMVRRLVLTAKNKEEGEKLRSAEELL